MTDSFNSLNLDPAIKYNDLDFTLSNARSLPSKIKSLVENIRELDLHFTILCETWFKTNKQTENELQELDNAEEIGSICKNRRGGRGGGVAIAYNKNKIVLKKHTIAKNSYEMVCAVGNTLKDIRKVAVFSLYIPPNQKMTKTKEMMECLADGIEKIKLEYNDPYIVIGGDFNGRNITATDDFPDLKIIQTGPTRKNKVLDIIITNIELSLARIISPLQTDEGVQSDHSTVHIRSKTPRLHQYTVKEYTTRRYTPEAEELFGNLLLQEDWSTITGTASEMALELDNILQRLVNHCFPLKIKKIRSCDPLWITKKIKRMIRNRKRMFKRYGRCAAWKRRKTMVDIAIRESKQAFFERVKERIKLDGNNAGYYKAVGMLGCNEAPKKWAIQCMFPHLTDKEIAESGAAFFNGISAGFLPARKPDRRYCKDPPPIHEVAAALRKIKKPKSAVQGDIDGKLVTKYSDILAIPLFAIFSSVYETLEWPTLWSTETVHLIPKTKAPSELKQLRNLSCTPLFSKTLETFVLNSLRTTTKLSSSQFGATKGSGVEHFLVESWNDILEPLEDHRASVQLMSVDFEKAYNRMDHNICLDSLSKLGAKKEDVELVCAFLNNRTMSVKVGTSFSDRKPVTGGSPQGSILGNFLFCASTDEFTDLSKK